MKAKIYTKTGDKGQTSLVGGTRVSKTNPRLLAYGTLDELNSVLGLVRSSVKDQTLSQSLQGIQNALFNIGSHLACEDEKILPSLPRLKPENIASLEKEMDSWESSLPPLRNFILPGGSVGASYCHLARTVCRRAEREVIHLSETVAVENEFVVFLNRLSDWLFLLARKVNADQGVTDVQWDQT
jgi:cob(I)alamin adenosyltransferase